MRTNILKKGLLLPLLAIMFAFSSVAASAQIDTSDFNDDIWFPSQWNKFAMEVNEEFAMTFTAETALDCDCPIHYEIILDNPFPNQQLNVPTGIEIDEMSGLVTWVPETPGEYYFGVRAFIEGQPEVSAMCYNFIMVDRPFERPCAAINVDLVFPENNPQLPNQQFGAVVKAVPVPNPYNVEYYGDLKQNNRYKIRVPAGSYDVKMVFYTNSNIPEEFSVNETPIVLACDETSNLSFNVTEEMIPDMVIINNFPEPSYLKIGETYTYDCDAYSTKGNEVRYRLVQGAPNAEFNEETGLLSWTPQAPGHQVFTLIAYTVNDSSVMNYQSWALIVKGNMPEECVNVFGTITNSLNTPIQKGYIVAFPMMTDSTNIWFDKAFDAKIESDGTYRMTLPEGSYKFLVQAKGCVPEFFDNQTSFELADTYTFECGDSVNLSTELEAIAPIEFIQVSGTVTNEETAAGLHAEVRFIVQDPNWDCREIEFEGEGEINFDGKSFWAETDRSGEYTINVPKNIDLKAVAVSYDWTYLQEFYNNTDKYELAQVLNMSENTSGINFTLERYQDTTYTNGFAGRVINAENQPVRAIVTAIRIPGEEENADYSFENVPTNQEGDYIFNNLQAGNYIVFAMPINAPLLPGFFVNNDFAAWNWQEATIINLDGAIIQQLFEIKLRDISDMPGIGRIRGKIGKKHGGLAFDKENTLNGNGIADAFVVIYDKDRKAVKHTMTNAEGNFDLANLAFGEYKVAVSKVGYDFMEQTVTINAEKSEEVAMMDLVEVNNTLDVETEITSNNKVYPNPASTIANLVFDAADGNAVVTITTLQGEILASFDVNTNKGSNSFSFTTTAIANGLYLIKVTGSTNFQTLLNVIR